jgi:Ca-activated chloride channel family protein
MTRTVRFRRAFFFALFLGLCLATLPFLTPAQEDQASKIDTDLVSVPVVVLDEKGRRVPELAQTDFAITDNGQPVEPAFFAAGAGPVAVVFALDDSFSVRQLVAQQQAASLSLLERFGGDTEVAVLRFGATPQVSQQFTADRESLRGALEFTNEAARKTAIFDAALASVKTLNERPERRFERRIVILLSDGLDNASRVQPDSVIAAARAAGITFYVVHLPLYTIRDEKLAERSVSKGFRDLANRTGGMFLAGPKVTKEFTSTVLLAAQNHSTPFDLAPLLKAIEDDLNGQYVLAYYAKPEAGAGVLHHLEVRANPPGKKKLTVQVLRGDFTLKQ